MPSAQSWSRLAVLAAVVFATACTGAGLPTAGGGSVRLGPQPPAFPPPASVEVQPPAVPRSFRAAKRVAFKLHHDHQTTFYCGCGYDARSQISRQACGYQPRRENRRAARMEWEHVVPAAAFGRHRACWREPACVNGRGKSIKGRKCCRRSDAEFRRMEADLHNLVPAIGELNGDRRNYPFGEVAGEPREYGCCDFEIDRAMRTVEPAPQLRGDIARAYLYMHQTYGDLALPLGDDEMARFRRWDAADPATDWERERGERIVSIQTALR